MSRVVILGSSNATSTPGHENTHMVIAGAQRMVLVDCGGNPLLRLEKAGFDFHRLTDVIITHFHPDHVSGLPLLLMDMWLQGRTSQLNVYGLQYTLDRVEQMMGLFSWSEWPDFYPVAFHRISLMEKVLILDCPDFKVTGSPVRHFIPNLGIRFDFHESGRSLAYSCDTEPCEEVTRLAAGADVLIHEATGEQAGHSSAAQAAEIAMRANAETLCLIHYPTGRFANGDPVTEARGQFRRRIMLAHDFMELEL